MTEMCQYLKNWFNRKPDGSDYKKWFGDFIITNGVINRVELAEGQYYRVMGSVFNDGVHQYGDTLTDETFEGAVWAMGVPKAVIDLANDIGEWQEQYGTAGADSMSPFQSESFGGYSYSKGSNGASGVSKASVTTWQAVFADRLAVWKKV